MLATELETLPSDVLTFANDVVLFATDEDTLPSDVETLPSDVLRLASEELTIEGVSVAVVRLPDASTVTNESFTLPAIAGKPGKRYCVIADVPKII